MNSLFDTNWGDKPPPFFNTIVHQVFQVVRACYTTEEEFAIFVYLVCFLKQTVGLMVMTFIATENV